MTQQPTIESLDETVQLIKASADELRHILYPHGRPDWMSQEEWKLKGGE